MDRQSVSIVGKKVIRNAWIFGLIPVSHTWFLSGPQLESRATPVYLLLVFLVASASWSWLEKGSLGVLAAIWIGGWGASFLLVQAVF